MPLRPRSAAGLLAGPAALALALAPTGVASAVDVPGVSSRVDPVTVVPDPGMISGTFAHTGEFFYSSGLGDLRVYDTSDPRAPRLLGATTQVEFENEAMTYAERDADRDGELERYVFVGNDLTQVTGPSTDDPVPPIGGAPSLFNEVIVFDVSDAGAPREVSRFATTTSAHTLTCATVSCEYAYSAGDSGVFSVLDLRDVTAPTELATVESPAAKGPFDAGHYWDVDSDGRTAWHTGGGGAAAFDIRRPEAPRLLNSTNAEGTSRIDAGENENYNDFILHNSVRPNGDRFRPGAEPSLRNGNVLLVTEEDYANDGDEIVCERSGSVESWYVPDLKKRDPASDTGTGTIEPLDRLNPIDTPVQAFCSAHWFYYHQDGFLAQGFYNGGLQVIDVRNPRDLQSYGFFRTPAATQVWDAYWVPVRDEDGVATGEKTDLVYTADAVQGLGVYDVQLPDEAPATAPSVLGQLLAGPVLPIGGGTAALLLGAAVLRRRTTTRGSAPVPA